LRLFKEAEGREIVGQKHATGETCTEKHAWTSRREEINDWLWKGACHGVAHGRSEVSQSHP